MITNEKWDAIEKKLEGWFSDVSFLYDGHSVRVQKLPFRENVLRLFVFIDGTIDQNKSIDLHKKGFDPLVTLFWRRSERYAFDRKYRQSLIKYNKAMKSLGSKDPPKDPNAKLIVYHPDFATAKSLVRQFRRIEGLTFVQEKEYVAITY